MKTKKIFGAGLVVAAGALLLVACAPEGTVWEDDLGVIVAANTGMSTFDDTELSTVDWADRAKNPGSLNGTGTVEYWKNGSATNHSEAYHGESIPSTMSPETTHAYTTE